MAAEPLHHYIEKLYRFHLWRVERITKHLQSLPDSLWDQPVEGSFGTLRLLVTHCHWGERVWLSRFWGIPRPPDAEVLMAEFPSTAAIGTAWHQSARDLLAYLSALTEETVIEPLHYQDAGGNEHEMRKIDLLYHVVDHASYHCGQIITILRSMSKEPVATSYVAYLRDQKGQLH